MVLLWKSNTQDFRRHLSLSLSLSLSLFLLSLSLSSSNQDRHHKVSSLSSSSNVNNFWWAISRLDDFDPLLWSPLLRYRILHILLRSPERSISQSKPTCVVCVPAYTNRSAVRLQKMDRKLRPLWTSFQLSGHFRPFPDSEDIVEHVARKTLSSRRYLVNARNFLFECRLLVICCYEWIVVCMQSHAIACNRMQSHAIACNRITCNNCDWVKICFLLMWPYNNAWSQELKLLIFRRSRCFINLFQNVQLTTIIPLWVFESYNYVYPISYQIDWNCFDTETRGLKEWSVWCRQGTGLFLLQHNCQEANEIRFNEKKLSAPSIRLIMTLASRTEY